MPASFPYDRKVSKVWACGYACVGHAYAENLWGPWFDSLVPAANNTATWTDGTSSVLGSRKRAQVLTDEEGDVTVLFNGVSGGVGAPGQSYTLATPTAAYRSAGATTRPGID